MSKDNVKNPKEENANNAENKPIGNRKNIEHILQHYYNSDSEQEEPEEEGNNNYLSNEDNTQKFPSIKEIPTKDPSLAQTSQSIKIVQLKPKKFSTIAKENINRAVEENMNKKQYTAYTFSTIQKKKDMKKEIKKPSVFEKKVLPKKYKGKSDTVALYQMYQNDWKKKTYLKK